jgi:hypothetical protein
MTAPSRSPEASKKKKQQKPVSTAAAAAVPASTKPRGRAHIRDRDAPAGEAIAAMRSRGINNPGELLNTFADAEAVLGACRWFDRRSEDKRSQVGPGLLAKVIRDGGMPGYGQQPAVSDCLAGPEIEQQWSAVLAGLEERATLPLLAQHWLTHLHPHAFTEAGWTLGAQRHVIGWLRKYRPAIDQAAGCPVAIESCERGARR